VKEIVLVTLSIDTATGRIDPDAPFMVNSRVPDEAIPIRMSRGSSLSSGPGETQARFEG
jgi:hypothetical protein